MASVRSSSVTLAAGDIGVVTPLKDETGANIQIFRGDIIRWVCSAGAAGNKATLLHGTKQSVIYDTVTNLANWTDWHKCPKDYLDGIFLSVLGAGTLYIQRAEGKQT